MSNKREYFSYIFCQTICEIYIYFAFSSLTKNKWVELGTQFLQSFSHPCTLLFPLALLLQQSENLLQAEIYPVDVAYMYGNS